MLSIEEAKIRVARGAAHLDAHRPGWFTQIDVGTLTLSSCYHCTLGQLYGEFRKGLQRLRFTWPIGNHWTKRCDAVRHGFALAMRDSSNPDTEADGFRLLQDTWIAEIAARRCGAGDNEPTVPPEGVRVGQPQELPHLALRV